MYKKTTDDVLVKVKPSYLDEQSAPDESHYVWSYHVTIKNTGETSIQLRSRHWRIIDARGHTEEVSGDGVVGEQPVLNPGESYEYTSGAPLRTPTGFMEGSYIMEHANGNHFSVDIPLFSLDSPYQHIVLH